MIVLLAIWLASPTIEMRELGISDVSFVGRYVTIEDCVTVRDSFRHGPNAYHPGIKFKCVDLRLD